MANLRTIYKMIVHPRVATCRLQMVLTTLQPGSVWNTMPSHVQYLGKKTGIMPTWTPSTPEDLDKK